MSKYKLKVTTNWVGARTEIDLIDDWGMSEYEAIDILGRFKSGKLTKDEEAEFEQAAIEAAHFEWYLTDKEDKYEW